MSKFYSIYPNEDFFKHSAELILKEAYDKNSPEKLAECLIWVPSGRMMQSLKHALTKQLGNFAILPKIRTVGLNESDIQSLQFFDSDGDFAQDVYPKTSKLLYFAKAIKMAMPDWTIQQCFTESLSLTKLHQDLQNYDITLEELKEAVPSELASHWEKNLRVVQAVFNFYDDFLKTSEKQDIYTLERKSVEKFLEYKDSQSSVFAIGFNDSTVLGKKLLKQIAELENGKIVFPYINPTRLEEKSSKLTPSDSEFAITELAKLLNVENLEYIGEHIKQLELINKAFLTASETHLWAEEIENVKLDNLSIINADNILHESKLISLIMRETLETKDKTCALISPNRELAQKVIQELKKWDVHVNDSAGIPLQKTAKGQLCTSLLDVVIEDFSTETVIPLITNSQVDKEFDFNLKQSIEDFVDLAVIGANVDTSVEAMQRKIKQQMPWQDSSRVGQEKIDSALNILNLLKNATQKLSIDSEFTIKEWAFKHLDSILIFMSDSSIFDSDDGKALLELFTNLKEAESDTKVNLRTYLHTFSLLAGQIVVRQSKNLHPRLFVWGAPESRLQNIDRVIIADFNDSTWPGKVSSNLWLNPAIRQQLGMPDISVSAGLNAYDFFNQLFAKEVFITRSKQTNQGPTLPSRFLVRLENTLSIDNFKHCINKGKQYIELLGVSEDEQIEQYLKINVFDSTLKLENGQHFPKDISATSVRDLANCPYKFYLNKVLHIKPIENIEDIPPNIWGQTVHLMLEDFSKEHKFPLTDDKKAGYKATFDNIINQFFESIASNRLELSWRYKLETIAEKFIQIMLNNSYNVVATEQELKYNGFKAIIDRVDKTEDGFNVIDYKTGNPPTKKDMMTFKDPQLLIESYILEKNNRKVNNLIYWQMKGYGAKPIDEKPVGYTKEKDKDDFETFKQESYKTLEDMKEYFSTQNVEYNPYSYGEQNNKDSVCKYCQYSGVCRKFSK